MMKKIMNAIKEYKVAIISSLAFLIVGLVVIFTMRDKFIKISEKTLKTDKYAFKYDTTWKVKEKKENSVRLAHVKDGQVDIQIINLGEEYQYGTSDDILDELLHGIKKQNKGFKLLSKEKSFVTKYNYDGYKLLYENNENQVMVTVGKKADKILMVTYEAINSSFDILLDSVQNMIYDFQILDSSFDLSYKLNVDTTNIKWSKNSKIKDASKVVECEMADNNYWVKYVVPKKFKATKKDSTGNRFNYEELDDGSIDLSSHIYNVNIYEYLEKDDKGVTLYSDYKSQRKGKDGYSDFKEYLQEVDSKYGKAYIYKTTYKNSSEYGTSKYEDVVLTFELDTSHIAIFKIEARNAKIAKELVDNIKIKSIKNYSSYIENKIIDDKLIGELQNDHRNDYDKVREITLKLPTKYTEIDYENNKYEYRYYGLNYDEKKEMYDYKIEYSMHTYVDSTVKNISDVTESYEDYGKFEKITYSSAQNINGKNVKIYKGGYTNKYSADLDKIGGTTYYVNYVVVIYEFDDNSCLAIEIEGNGKEITDDIISELLDFDENLKKK